MTTPADTAPLRILGIDPGLHVTGYGVLEVGARRSPRLRGRRRPRDRARPRQG